MFTAPRRLEATDELDGFTCGEAAIDVSGTASYIAFDLQNPAAAQRLVDSVEEGILEHLKNPTMAPTYRTTRNRPMPYYWFLAGNHRVFYVVDGDAVEVRRLLYRARDIESIIK